MDEDDSDLTMGFFIKQVIKIHGICNELISIYFYLKNDLMINKIKQIKKIISSDVIINHSFTIRIDK